MTKQDLLISSSISIILTTFNEENYIIRCLESIEKTGIKNVFIEDANSSDKTLQLIRNFKSDLEITLFTNNYRKPPYDAIFDLIKVIKTEWYYLIGADDILEPNSFRDFSFLLKNNPHYHIPLIDFWSEVKNKSLGKYPQRDWLLSLNNKKSKNEIIETCVDYGTLDVLSFAVSKKSISLWAYKELKFTTKEGLFFWIILVSILLEKEKPLVSTTKEVSLIKTFDQKTPSGNEHPLNDRVIESGLLYLSKCTLNSIHNVFKISIKFKLPIKSICILLFRDRGQKVNVRPICKAPLSKNIVIKILRKLFKLGI